MENNEKRAFTIGFVLWVIGLVYFINQVI